MVLADHLENEGFNVLESGSADRAIELIKNGAEVDLIVTDVQMPGQYNGITLALWVRDNHHPSS